MTACLFLGYAPAQHSVGTVTTNWTLTSADTAINVCGDVVVTLPAAPGNGQAIAITNICGGAVTVPAAPMTVAIEPMVFGVSYDALAVGTPYKWTLSRGFTALNALSSEVTGASADGNVVVGVGVPSTVGVWFDIADDTDLNISLAGATDTIPNAVSADGAVACGAATVGASQHAFVWNQNDGATDITPAATAAGALAISDDGLTVLVTADGGNYVWTLAGGLVSLGLPGGYVATNLSGDGVVVVGATGTGNGFVYNRTTAATTIITGEIPEECSTDGSVFITAPAGGAHITLRTPSGNTVINPLTGYHTFDAFYLSADGAVIAGGCMQNVTFNTTGFIWTEASGIVYLGGVGAYYQNNVGAIAGGSVSLALTADIRTGTQVGAIQPSAPAPTAKPVGIIPYSAALSPSYGALMVSEVRVGSVGYTWGIGGSYYTAYSDGSYSLAYVY